MYRLYKYLIETIKYYFFVWYTSTWFYYNIIYKIFIFKETINKYCNNKEEASKWKNKKRFKFIPNNIKEYIITKIFE